MELELEVPELPAAGGAATLSSTLRSAFSTDAEELLLDAATARRWATRAYVGLLVVVDHVGMRKMLRSGRLFWLRAEGTGGRPVVLGVNGVDGGTRGAGLPFGVWV